MPLLIFLCFSTCLAQSVRQEAGTAVRFEVSPPRFMTPEEKKRAGDNLDPDLAMKCRISNPGTVTVYLYTDFANHIVPRGNRVRKSDKGLVWMLDSSGRESLKSPGFSPLKSGSWLTLFQGDAVEWDCGEISTPAEEIHALTAFLKIGGEDKEVQEVFSNFYKVPARNEK